jgi:hypothetical protein
MGTGLFAAALRTSGGDQKVETPSIGLSHVGKLFLIPALSGTRVEAMPTRMVVAIAMHSSRPEAPGRFGLAGYALTAHGVA